MGDFVHTSMGAVHLLMALLATISGTVVIAMRKGGKTHKRIGYVYVANMIGLNITALFIYDLFGYFGIFHYGAIFSLLTVLAGIVPAIRRKKGWIFRHYTYMFWSLMGLYAAFASETLVRVPNSPFFGMVGLASGIIFAIGWFAYMRLKKRWAVQFSALGK